MADFQELMKIFSVPRPNGSQAEDDTLQAIKGWLEKRGIPYSIHTFRQYPYFFECIGLWAIHSRTLLAAAIWLRWGWPALPIAIIGLVGGIVDVAFHFPLITFPGATRGENILVHFNPRKTPGQREVETGEADIEQELVLCAHYDSKTELLDHHGRMVFLVNLPLGLLLTLILGILGPVDRVLSDQGSGWSNITFISATLLSIPMLVLAWGLGINLLSGRILKQSLGAVDNGAACAILLALAGRLELGEPALGKTRVTIALFGGEEVNMQGSRAYVHSRDWPAPAAVLNLEAMAQDGEYVYWEKDGSIFRLRPTSPELCKAIAEAVAEVTGKPATPAGPVLSDGSSFIARGIPTTTLGTYHSVWKDRGFHRPGDNLERVSMDRLDEGVEILRRFVGRVDRGEVEMRFICQQ